MSLVVHKPQHLIPQALLSISSQALFSTAVNPKPSTIVVHKPFSLVVCEPLDLQALLSITPQALLPLQGQMSGKDFARSVVCSVHTNQIEEYLAKVEAMPAPLANAKV